MKKQALIFAALALAMLAGAANADQSFQYGSFSVGVNSYTDAKTDNAAKPNATLTYGVGQRITYGTAVATELQVVKLNNHILPAAQGVYSITNDRMILNAAPAIISLHGGIGARMGATTGVDVLIPTTLSNLTGVSAPVYLRAGFTIFQHKVDGARGLFNVGLLTQF